MPASARWPTAAIGGALVKTSASGPMPTSRYCDHIFFSMRSALSAIAGADPGFRRARSSPIAAVISARIAAAFSGVPRACSSITRSSIETAKVTPAAFTAWRSTGASSHGLFGSRLSLGVLARTSAKVPTRSPLASRASAAGSGTSQRSRMVGVAALMSTSSAPRRVTTDGPPTSGRQTRPTSVATSESSGRANVALTSSGMAFPRRDFSFGTGMCQRPADSVKPDAAAEGVALLRGRRVGCDLVAADSALEIALL